MARRRGWSTCSPVVRTRRRRSRRIEAVARVDLTGGTAAGKALGAIAGSRGVSYGAELAGHAPLLVFDDVDLDQAVAGACFAAFLAAGQTCVSAKRIFVARSIYDEFASRLAKRADRSRVGDPFAPETDVGPLVSAKALAAARAVRRRERRPDFSWRLGRARRAQSAVHFFRPSVLAGDPALDCFREECFAPVVCIAPFDDEADAITKANASAYALGAGVWTRDVGRAHRVSAQLNAGVAWVSCHVCTARSVLGDGVAVRGSVDAASTASLRHRAGTRRREERARCLSTERRKF